MADLTSLPLQLHAKKCVCRAVIETPKGCRNKFDYDPDSGLFMLGGLLHEGMMFPFDFGFIPSTLGGDGDPLDILVLMDAPAHVGCLIEVRIIGVIEATQTEDGKIESNNRLLGVAIHSYDHQDLESISDVSKTLLDQLEQFFISYNKQRGKSGWLAAGSMVFLISDQPQTATFAVQTAASSIWTSWAYALTGGSRVSDRRRAARGTAHQRSVRRPR